MVNAFVGPAWEEPVKEASGRKWYRLLLDLGVLGSLPCRVVENSKQANDKAPTHLVFYSPVADGEDVRIGALWPHVNEETKAEYLMGELQLDKLGLVELKGGAKIDFRLLAGGVGIRLSAVKQRASEKSPTHHAWRTKARMKAPAAGRPAEEADIAPDSEEGDETAAA